MSERQGGKPVPRPGAPAAPAGVAGPAAGPPRPPKKEPPNNPAKEPAPPRKRQRETAADRARLGSVIAGTYRIDEIIGRGAIGAVFGGMHLRLERRVAIKFVDPTLVDDPEIRARFKREARIAAQIGSSHAVEVFDYGVGEDGAPYIVMERLDGEDVHQRLVREGRFSPDRALRIAKQVCRALGAAHGNGIVHRDLKPENVYLVERDGLVEFVKVVDFGLSTFVSSDDTRLTRAGQSVGTPLYMAPEQAGATQFDARVDVYSLGVLIFEMTTGRLPFEAATLQALLVALATQPPRSIRYYCPELPIELDDLVLRFIARDPRVRPKTAAAALAEILALEERLEGKRAQASGTQKVGRSVAIDGLPGQLPGPFVDEVSTHLDELRRTGKLSTSQIMSEPPPSSSGADLTTPMDRVSFDRMSAPAPVPVRLHQDPPPARPSKTQRAEPRPSQSRTAAASRNERTSERPAASPSVRRMQRAEPEEEVDEDSGLFYGRVGSKDSPRPIQLNPQPSKPERRRTASKAPPAGPPRFVLYGAFAVFLVVAVLVALKIFRP
ncbi:MAG: protein kinase [Myxococcales bacterium]|nr:protein kinase [Myxococcales bacterium]